MAPLEMERGIGRAGKRPGSSIKQIPLNEKRFHLSEKVEP